MSDVVSRKGEPVWKNGKCINKNPLDEVNVSLQKESLIERYCFFYENASLILAAFLAECLDINLYIEIVSKTNLDKLLKDEKYQYVRNRFVRSDIYVDFMAFVEEALLGDLPIKSTFLYQLVNNILNDDDLYQKLKKEYSLDNENIGYGKFDLALKVLLDCTWSFIDSQKGKKTAIYNTSEDGWHNLVSCYPVREDDIAKKKEVLDRYYDILSYSNSNEVLIFNEKGLDYNFSPPEKTLVSYNVFNAAFSSIDKYGEMIWQNNHFIDLEKKKEIYFKYHDELPWDLKGKCCDTFLIKEDNVFYHENSYITLCPCCGEKLSVEIPLGKTGDRIRNRIMLRCLDDKILDRKICLLSELYFLGGNDKCDEQVKKKIKDII